MGNIIEGEMSHACMTHGQTDRQTPISSKLHPSFTRETMNDKVTNEARIFNTAVRSFHEDKYMK